MKQRVLFLCTGNSARSQMAEGWLRRLAGDRFEVFSAGTQPVGLNPGAVAAMAEVGIDVSQQRSKHVSEFRSQTFDHVITVCDRAKESCPVWPGTTHVLHWSFDDPAASTDSPESSRALFRRVRDEIGDRIKRFLDTSEAEE
ncbi:arsenate reductase ArsC [Nitrospirales bacterium NOB]|nr:MAG: arsenate reductase [Nitrospira sp. OLB3]MBV6471433.1 Arsenate reductase [Nitrospirota bacterium]MCE7965602.1 arsenate reductase ArsC [Nitrospira sp. NTP2]MDL1889181.1 arsenate reductase ArsC [Nitrospirales bacterium NOB]MEB2339383.1 arsenate reductase ArsC [Nitrospirales bacterium]QOJ36028.1 MAG: arsenate reductase ArsC [Nitrospira sp.]